MNANQPRVLVTDKASLVAEAAAQNAQWPQYLGHWDGPEWTVMRATRDLKTKAGLAFKAGDVVLAKAEPTPEGGKPCIVAYSFRTTHDTGVVTKMFVAA